MLTALLFLLVPTGGTDATATVYNVATAEEAVAVLNRLDR